MANPLHTFFGGRRLVRGAGCVEPQRPRAVPAPAHMAEAYRLGQVRCIDDITLTADRARQDQVARQNCCGMPAAAQAVFHTGFAQEYADLAQLIAHQGGNMREVMRRAHWARMQSGGKA